MNQMSQPLLIDGTAMIDGGAKLSKAEIVQQLLTQFSADGFFDSQAIPSLLEAVMRTESFGTTGLGAGIAIPNARHAAVPRYLILIALCRVPVNFDSLDGEPTSVFALCLAPRDAPGMDNRENQKRSERLIRLFANLKFCERLQNTTTAQELKDCFAEDKDYYSR